MAHDSNLMALIHSMMVSANVKFIYILSFYVKKTARGTGHRVRYTTSTLFRLQLDRK